MISTFLPAQALRTSRKTGGLNSRPSCVCDPGPATACACCLSHALCLVSAGRVLTTVSRSAVRSSREACSARAAALARRRRASCAETAMWEGHCCLHGPSHQGSHPRLSPWLRPSANVSRLEAPFCCFMARARATLNEQCQPSEGEALLNWSNGVEASRTILGIPLRTTTGHQARLGRAGISHTRHHK